ncbi:cupin domain-containing protein [Streptomyces sp. NPDC049597]|uniref:cupin domain-containing protein n=1 Tax=Streptomyces sp. NPDC049597 TaxID=3155276 RepID=UPI00343BAA59
MGLLRGEVIHVPSGRMTREEKGGTTTEVAPGTTAVFPIGRQGTWTLHERLRKVFVIYRPSRRPAVCRRWTATARQRHRRNLILKTQPAPSQSQASHSSHQPSAAVARRLLTSRHPRWTMLRITHPVV